MPRKLVDIAHVNVRIRESLRRKLEREAKKNRTSLNNEIRVRLEESFENSAVRDLDEIAADQKVTWGRFSRRLLLLSLEDDLARELAQTKDPNVANLAKAWLVQWERQQQNDGGES
jgi:Arc-like DNA binding domain